MSRLEYAVAEGVGNKDKDRHLNIDLFSFLKVAWQIAHETFVSVSRDITRQKFCSISDILVIFGQKYGSSSLRDPTS